MYMCMLIRNDSWKEAAASVLLYNSSGIKKNKMVIHSTSGILATLTVDRIDSNGTCAHIFELILHDYSMKFEEDMYL